MWHAVMKHNVLQLNLMSGTMPWSLHTTACYVDTLVPGACCPKLHAEHSPMHEKAPRTMLLSGADAHA